MEDACPHRFSNTQRLRFSEAIRIGPWKMHVRIASQTRNDYGFQASREKPLLFQLEQDLGERIDRAGEQPERVAAMLATLSEFVSQVEQEGSFWDRDE